MSDGTDHVRGPADRHPRAEPLAGDQRPVNRACRCSDRARAAGPPRAAVAAVADRRRAAAARRAVRRPRRATVREQSHCCCAVGDGDRRHPRQLSRRLPGRRREVRARLGDPRRDRQGRVRPRPRPRPLMHRSRRRELRRRRRPDAVPRRHLDQLRRHPLRSNRHPPLPAGTTSTRSTPPPTTCAHPARPATTTRRSTRTTTPAGTSPRSSSGPPSTAPQEPRSHPRAPEPIRSPASRSDATTWESTPTRRSARQSTHPQTASSRKCSTTGTHGQPLLLFRVPETRPPGRSRPTGTSPRQITPVSTTIGTIFRARAAVARYAPCCTGIEIGWGSPTSTSAHAWQDETDPGAANPPAGGADNLGRELQALLRHPLEP